MPVDPQKLARIHQRTSGLCHICREPVPLQSYGKRNLPGGWEIEHSRPRAKGGTDHGNNLFAACCDCNRKKGIKHTRTARKTHGFRAAPLNEQKAASVRFENIFICGAIGAAAGGAIANQIAKSFFPNLNARTAGWIGAGIGALCGIYLGKKINPHPL